MCYLGLWGCVLGDVSGVLGLVCQGARVGVIVWRVVGSVAPHVVVRRCRTTGDESPPWSAGPTTWRLIANRLRPRSLLVVAVFGAGVRVSHSVVGTRASKMQASPSRRKRSPSRMRPIGPPRAASGVKWIAVGNLPEAPETSVGDQGDPPALVLQQS